jgi:hypothetical protein
MAEMETVSTQHAMETSGGVWIRLGVCLTSALDEGLLHTPASLPPVSIIYEAGWTVQPICTV